MSPHIGRHFFVVQVSMLSIATWNINSIRKRMAQLERLAELCTPDVICLQETKCADALFPRKEIEDLGYVHQAYAGQKAYNGVAILSKFPLSQIDLHRHCGRDDARHVSAVVGEGEAAVKIHSLYVPAGGPIADRELNPKFDHKLKFVDAIADFFAGHHGLSDAAVVAGDFNIAPLPSDVWDHARMSRIVTHTPIEIAALERMKRALYFIDALREVHPAENPVFTWWSYRAADWLTANKGRRLDHIWVTPALKDRIANVEVLMDVRHWTPPSDHVPVVLSLKP